MKQAHGTFTPPEVAQRWRVKPERVRGWIRNGELLAFDVSDVPGVGRPRYRITKEAVREFENRRNAAEVKTNTVEIDISHSLLLSYGLLFCER